MTDIAAKNGSIIVKDGSVAERCECCSSCVPSQKPDYIEVDISSSSEQDEYGSVRYRTGRNATFVGECETDYADAYLAFGVPSGTYLLQQSSSFFGYLHGYSYAGPGLALNATVMTSATAPWAGAFENKFGKGVELVIQPFRIVTHSKKWLTYSSGSASVATEQELRALSNELGQEGRNTTSSAGVTHVKKTLGNFQDFSSLPLSTRIYADAIFPCVGGDEVFGSTHPLGSVSGTIPSSQTPVLTISGSRPIAPSYLGPYQLSPFTDDMPAIEQWDTFIVPNCGRRFPFPYLISISGAFQKTADYTDTQFTDNGMAVPFHVVDYDWIVARQLSVTAIRGRMYDGSEVRLI